MRSATFLLVLCLARGGAADNPAPATATAAMQIREGSPLPKFESMDQHGRVWKSADHVGKRIVVLYSYPGDFSGGCIRQAQSFRESLVRLEAAGVEVVGLSGDTAATHELFQAAHELKHTLLADPEGNVAAQLGMPVRKGGKVRARALDGRTLLVDANQSIIVERPVTLPRWTIVIGRDGKVISLRTKVEPAKDADEVLAIVAALNDED